MHHVLAIRYSVHVSLHHVPAQFRDEQRGRENPGGCLFCVHHLHCNAPPPSWRTLLYRALLSVCG